MCLPQRQRFLHAAQSYYNKPYLGINPINCNPFDEYKIVEPPIKKRNSEGNQLKTLRDCKVNQAVERNWQETYLCCRFIYLALACGFICLAVHSERSTTDQS